MILVEKEAENFLEKHDFDVIKRKLIKKEEELGLVEIKFPWAMKASGKNINHKLKIGAVLLNIKTINQAKEAFKQLKKIDGCEEILIQPMQTGFEFILGLKKTEEFGMALMFGLGGSKVESEKEVSFRIIPLKEQDAKEMLREVKILDKLSKEANTELIIKNILKLSELAETHQDISELDINPLIANNSEAKVVDARIILD